MDDLNARFDSQLLREKPNTALSWYLNREEDHLQADGSLSPRILWHNDLILPPKVEPVLRELCSSFSWGHLHPDCPPDKVGQFRLVRSSHLASGGAGVAADAPRGAGCLCCRGLLRTELAQCAWYHGSHTLASLALTWLFSIPSGSRQRALDRPL